MHDAKRDLQASFPATRCKSEFGIDDLLYADDTLFVGSDREVLEEYMRLIGKYGASYGMSFNYDKLECMQVNCDHNIINDLGLLVKSSASLKYLGALIAHDGKHNGEINRRIGFAKEEFRNIRACWGHPSLSLREKLNIYQALVLSKLFHGLESVCLLAHEKRQLNGFHASCCRAILNLSHAYINRVSNHHVFRCLQTRPLSNMVLQRQLLFVGFSCKTYA